MLPVKMVLRETGRMEIKAREFTEDSTRTSRITTGVLRVLITVAVVRFWLMPLHTSFWTDETGTFWTIKDGLRSMFERIELWPNTSPLFGIIAWLAYRAGDRHEYAMRLPSVLAMAAAAWLLSRLAVRLLGSGSALPVVAVFISLQPVNLGAAEARPYALVFALGTGATLALVKWLDTGNLN
jgi:mannosyltransferase